MAYNSITLQFTGINHASPQITTDKNVYCSWLPQEPHTLCNVDIINPTQYTTASSTCSTGWFKTWIFMPHVNTAYDRKFPTPHVYLYVVKYFGYIVIWSFTASSYLYFDYFAVPYRYQVIPSMPDAC